MDQYAASGELDGVSREEMDLWLATLSKRQDLRENEAAEALERTLISEALYEAGARTAARVRAVFHHLKTKAGLVYWPSPAQVRQAANELSRGQASKNQSGDRDALSFDELSKLQDKVLPAAKRWVEEYPAGSPLHQHGQSTLDYWGEARPQ